MSGRSAHLQGLLHTPCWNVSARSADRESLLQSLNSPMPNSVRSFICNLSRRLVSRSLSQTPRAGVSVRSAGGEFLLYAPCWNLSCYSSNWKSLLHALCCSQFRHLVSVEFILHTRFWNQYGRFTDGETLLHAPVLFCVWSFVGLGVSPTHSVLGPVLSFW